MGRAPLTSTNASTRLSGHISMTAQVAEIPTGVLTPYSIVESLQIRNTLTVGYGAQHTRRRGIPKGCPFLMTFTALLVRPWILQVQKRGAVTRVLADDLRIAAAGEKHYQRILESYQRCPHLHHHSRRTNRCQQELRVFD